MQDLRLEASPEASFSYLRLDNTSVPPTRPPEKEMHAVFSGQSRSSKESTLYTSEERRTVFSHRCVMIECLCNCELGNNG